MNSYGNISKQEWQTKRYRHLIDVARTAIIFVSTLSQLLNDKDVVAPETYAHTKEVIAEHGCTSSLTARWVTVVIFMNTSKSVILLSLNIIIRLQAILYPAR